MILLGFYIAENKNESALGVSKRLILFQARPKGEMGAKETP